MNVMAIPATKAAWTALPTAAVALLAAVDTTPLTIAALGLVSSVTVAIVGWRQTLVKENQAATDRLLGHLETRLIAEESRSTQHLTLADERQTAMLSLQKEILKQQVGIWALTRQLHKLGVEPEWDPEESEERT